MTEIKKERDWTEHGGVGSDYLCNCGAPKIETGDVVSYEHAEWCPCSEFDDSGE